VFLGGSAQFCEYGRCPFGNVRVHGGHTDEPTYREVCGGRTGHAEAVEVLYDPSVVDFKTLAKQFFEMHDASIPPRGKGGQYRSAVFYTSEAQKKTVAGLIDVLAGKGVTVHTEVGEAPRFWPAEPYHQDYFQKRGEEPSCHGVVRLFAE